MSVYHKPGPDRDRHKELLAAKVFAGTADPLDLAAVHYYSMREMEATLGGLDIVDVLPVDPGLDEYLHLLNRDLHGRALERMLSNYPTRPTRGAEGGIWDAAKETLAKYEEEKVGADRIPDDYRALTAIQET